MIYLYIYLFAFLIYFLQQMQHLPNQMQAQPPQQSVKFFQSYFISNLPITFCLDASSTL